MQLTQDSNTHVNTVYIHGFCSMCAVDVMMLYALHNKM